MKTDKIGRKFGKLTVLSMAPSFVRKDRNGTFSMCKCACECGSHTIVRLNNLVSGITKSCGCLVKERSQNRSKGPPGEAGLIRVYVGYKGSAKKRNRKFELSKEQFKKLTQDACHYCGSPPVKLMTTGSKNSNYYYNGIDRKDNTLGYVLDNCLSCCECCNKAKGTKSYEEFIEWIKRLTSFRSIL